MYFVSVLSSVAVDGRALRVPPAWRGTQIMSLRTCRLLRCVMGCCYNARGVGGDALYLLLRRSTKVMTRCRRSKRGFVRINRNVTILVRMLATFRVGWAVCVCTPEARGGIDPSDAGI